MLKHGVWVAIMESEHYTWRAAGMTEEEAIETIVREWNYGTGCDHRTPMTKEELEEEYDLYAEFLEFGKCEWD